ncbi:MAG TPA: class I SAM-dependent methyltransferase [Burkholderiaceae bacterium]|nr:class I SAM-dependent methyltransferase [Burkholderiaceae bacterium]
MGRNEAIATTETDAGARAPAAPRCRHCGAQLHQTLVDLGSSPLCNSLLDAASLNAGESFYPLHVRVCGQCFLAQLDEFVSPSDIFSEYSYFSSFSGALVAQSKRYVDAAIERFGLSSTSRAYEVASNDGYLLQHFVARGIPVLGIEPALNVADAARKKGIPTISVFLGSETGAKIRAEHGPCDIVAANNVMAHTPYLNDFVLGLKALIKPDGVITVEFPHLFKMIEDNTWDMIYHEHFSYFSFHAAERVFASQGLRIFDVEEIESHGGSFRIYGTHAQNDTHAVTPNVQRIRAYERERGVADLRTYARFAERVEESKRSLLECLIGLRRAGKRIVGYGVPGKGNTLLNYCGIRQDFLDYMVDKNPYKQGKYTPGTRIPIHAPERIFETRPDYVLIMPWNLRREIVEQLAPVRSWGGRFVVPLPNVEIID